MNPENWEKSSGYFDNRIKNACVAYLKSEYYLNVSTTEDGCQVDIIGELLSFDYLVSLALKIQTAFNMYLSGDFNLLGGFEYRYGG